MPQNHPEEKRNDPLLDDFLSARDEKEKKNALEILLEQQLNGVRRALRQRFIEEEFKDDPLHDLMGEIRIRLTTELNKCRESGHVIEHYNAYAETVSSRVCDEYFSQKRRIRKYILRQLNDLFRADLATSDGQPRFMVWKIGEQKVCGFDYWAGQNQRVTDEYLKVWQNPHLVKTEAFAAGSDPKSMDLSPLLEGLFSWLDTPLSVNEVIGFIMNLRDLDEMKTVRDEIWEDGEVRNISDSIPSPERHHELRYDERDAIRSDLRKVWENIITLPLESRQVLLLNLCGTNGEDLLHLLVKQKIIASSEIAQALEMTPNQLKTIASRLPLSDEEIAILLNVQRSAVSARRSRVKAELRKTFGKLFFEKM